MWTSSPAWPWPTTIRGWPRAVTTDMRSVWNYETGELVTALFVQQRPTAVNALAFSPTDEALCGCAQDMVFWNTSDWHESSRLPCNALAFAFDRTGKEVIMGTSHSGVVAWNGDVEHTPRLLHQFPAWVHAVATSPSQDFFVAASENGSLRVLDFDGGLRHVLSGGTAHPVPGVFAPRALSRRSRLRRHSAHLGLASRRRADTAHSLAVSGGNRSLTRWTLARRQRLARHRQYLRSTHGRSVQRSSRRLH